MTDLGNLQFLVLRQLMAADTWQALHQMVTPDFFADSEARKIYGRIQFLHGEGVGDLEPASVRASIDAVYADKDEQRHDELLAIMDAVEQQPVLPVAQARAIARDYVVRETGMRVGALLLNGAQGETFNPSEALGLLQRLTDGAGADATRVVSLFDPTILDVALGARGGVIPLGVSSRLDALLGGGLGNGELLVILAPPSRGKTSLLCKIGERAAAAGCRVLHVSLEISSSKVCRRYVQTVAKCTARHLQQNKEDVAALMAAAKEAWHGGEIHVITWPPKRMTLNDLQSELRRMRTAGTPVDYVILDYAALVKPAGFSREQRWTYGEIVQELRAIAIEEDCKIASAWQVNRQGAQTDELDPTDVAEAWEVIHHADVVLGINQTQEERRNHVLRLSVLKQRESESRPTAWLRANWDTMTVRGMGEAEMKRLGFVAEKEHIVEVDGADGAEGAGNSPGVDAKPEGVHNAGGDRPRLGRNGGSCAGPQGPCDGSGHVDGSEGLGLGTGYVSLSDGGNVGDEQNPGGSGHRGGSGNTSADGQRSELCETVADHSDAGILPVGGNRAA